MPVVWGLLAAAALLWPDRLSGPLDGIPLDRTAEVVFVAAFFPALWWFDRGFLATRAARVTVVVLLAWKAVSAAAFVSDGWCVRFEPARPYTRDQTGAPHAWDVRADWRDTDPACSALMTRPYRTLNEFPVWFFNLPPDGDSWPGPLDRPPGATTKMGVRGFLDVREAGVLKLGATADVGAMATIDGVPKAGDIPIEAGIHRISIDASLHGGDWQFMPTWNDRDVWSLAIATVKRPAALDRLVRPWANWISTTLSGFLLIAWAVAAILATDNAAVLAWTAAASLTIGLLVGTDHMAAARWAIPALAGAALVPVPSRLRNRRGAFLMIGVPWITYVAAVSAAAAGRFVLYAAGHDYWMFQRFAYRIVMQGYWLEGGSPTFWFQPLYRWIAGLLHLIVGESNVGEWFWDGACLLAGALLSYRIVRRSAGFRWGLAAAALPLAVFTLGTSQYLIGQGLGEISAAGFLSAAALCAMRGAGGRAAPLSAAGLLATLGFYTRLNNLPMALAVALFAWRPHGSLTPPAAIAAIVTSGVALFAWRTWHYTGVFSVFYGTQRDLLSIWQPGMSLMQVLRAMASSVLMVLTVNDPPRFDPYALPVLLGGTASLLCLLRVPGLRRLPAIPALYCLSGLAGALVARGSAYPGRFSMHIVPIACALFVCAVAQARGTGGRVDDPPDSVSTMV